ncbi:25630_t:CDS:2, partial [Gigaspora margarita]
MPNKLQTKIKEGFEAKKQKNSINVIKNSNNSDNASYDEVVENNGAMGIMKRPQATTKKYDNNTDLKDYNDDNLFAHNELLDERNSVHTKRRKRQQQCEAAKGTPMLYTFWNQEKSVEEADEVELNDDEGQLEEVNKNNDIEELLENEIKSII